VLMIALQEHAFRIAAFQFQRELDNVARRRAAIDVVADEYHRVARGRRDRLENRAQFIGASVDIADREQPSFGFRFLRGRQRHPKLTHRARRTRPSPRFATIPLCLEKIRCSTSETTPPPASLCDSVEWDPLP